MSVVELKHLDEMAKLDGKPVIKVNGNQLDGVSDVSVSAVSSGFPRIDIGMHCSDVSFVGGNSIVNFYFSDIGGKRYVIRGGELETIS